MGKGGQRVEPRNSAMHDQGCRGPAPEQQNVTAVSIRPPHHAIAVPTAMQNSHKDNVRSSAVGKQLKHRNYRGIKASLPPYVSLTGPCQPRWKPLVALKEHDATFPVSSGLYRCFGLLVVVCFWWWLCLSCQDCGEGSTNGSPPAVECFIH